MQVKKGIVEQVIANGTWEGKYGVMYKFEVVFTNGDVGEYSSKSKDQNKFEVGAEVEYEFTDGKFPKVKPHYSKPNGSYKSNSYGKSDDVQVKIVRQSMLKASIDFWAISPELKPSTEDIFKTANIFIDFVNQKSEPQFTQEFTHTGKTLEVSDLDTAKATDHLKEDLPF
jgi:major membrane immunogen (membrane-anchored lipoprotein)